MHINDITTISHKKNNNSNKNRYINNLVTRILLSIILFISIAIYVKYNSYNSKYIKKYFFTDSIKFTKINNWYQNKIGKLIPSKSLNNSMVFSNDDIKTNDYENYLNGVKINETIGNPIPILYGGIVVFIGEKDGYNNTVIIQGNDGIDYWYGNITNTNVNLYDYLEKNTIIGEAKDDYIYLVLEKDGNYLKYEEYFNENKN